MSFSPQAYPSAEGGGDGVSAGPGALYSNTSSTEPSAETSSTAAALQSSIYPSNPYLPHSSSTFPPFPNIHNLPPNSSSSGTGLSDGMLTTSDSAYLSTSPATEIRPLLQTTSTALSTPSFLPTSLTGSPSGVSMPPLGTQPPYYYHHHHPDALQQHQQQQLLSQQQLFTSTQQQPQIHFHQQQQQHSTINNNVWNTDNITALHGTQQSSLHFTTVDGGGSDVGGSSSVTSRSQNIFSRDMKSRGHHSFGKSSSVILSSSSSAVGVDGPTTYVNISLNDMRTQLEQQQQQQSQNYKDMNYARLVATAAGHNIPPHAFLLQQQQQQNNKRRDITEQRKSNTTDEQQRGRRELARRQQTALRRGLFSASELRDWMGEEYPGLDRQCIIRFPPSVAALLRERLAVHAARKDTAATEGTSSSFAASSPSLPPDCSPNNPLGLVINPRSDCGHRLFDIKVSGYKRRLLGVLVELPTLVETYKTLDGDLFFKSGDICQMIVVYNPSDEDEAIDLHALCEKQHWEWKAGLTPPTHRIRNRKYKNLDLFDRQEVRDAELQVLELLHSTRRDTYDLEVHTIAEMQKNIEQWKRDKSAARVAALTGNPYESSCGGCYNSESRETELRIEGFAATEEGRGGGGGREGRALIHSDGGGGEATSASATTATTTVTTGSYIEKKMTGNAAGRQRDITAIGGGGGIDTSVVEHIISCDEDILVWLENMGMTNDDAAACLSDYSDCLFEEGRGGGGDNNAESGRRYGKATGTTGEPGTGGGGGTRTGSVISSAVSSQQHVHLPGSTRGADMLNSGEVLWATAAAGNQSSHSSSNVNSGGTEYKWPSQGTATVSGGAQQQLSSQQLQQQELSVLQPRQQQQQEGNLGFQGVVDSQLLMGRDGDVDQSTHYVGMASGLLPPLSQHQSSFTTVAGAGFDNQQQLVVQQQQQKSSQLGFDAEKLLQQQQQSATGGLRLERGSAGGSATRGGGPAATTTTVGEVQQGAKQDDDERARKKLERKQKKMLKKERRRVRKEKKKKKDKKHTTKEQSVHTAHTEATTFSDVSARASGPGATSQNEIYDVSAATARGSLRESTQAAEPGPSQTHQQEEAGSSSPSSSSDDDSGGI